jgi:dTDP-4-amino-4,6-dideoxygalactose transaminase
MVEVCAKAGAILVEDAAASLGTRVGGRLTGTFGDAAFFSFDSTKLVNVPMKGGFVLAADHALSERVRAVQAAETSPMSVTEKCRLLLTAMVLLAIQQPLVYRIAHSLLFGWRNRFTEDRPGLQPHFGPFYARRMADWQARIALSQIDRIDLLVRRRQAIYAKYRSSLEGCGGLALPPPDLRGEWACVRFPVRVEGDKLNFYRRAVDLGVDFAFSFSFVVCPSNFVHAHRLAASILDLPFYEKLTEGEMRRVVQVVREVGSRASSAGQPAT